tara:strand:- start:253 stop:555 length:303 start_codon:yes stop_codon:yes gene_type:complete
LKNISFKFQNLDLVDFLWSELIESFGFDKAKKLISQAIDLQKMNGEIDHTMPIIFTSTGGIALISIDMIKKQINANNHKESQIIIFNPKKKLFQILYETK